MADLAPKRLPEPSGEAFGPLGVGFWRLRGSLFEASSASCGALLAEPSGEQAQAQDGSAGHAKRLQFFLPLAMVPGLEGALAPT